MTRSVWTKASRIVEAEQLTVHNVPEKVEVGQLGLTGKPVCTMVTAFGRVIVPMGTWILYDDEGSRPVRQDVFERLYRPVTVAGKALALGERVAKKIIGG